MGTMRVVNWMRKAPWLADVDARPATLRAEAMVIQNPATKGGEGVSQGWSMWF
jgi:hypothetical protein